VIQQLISRRIALAMQTNIPDMDEYAEEWNKLAADFEAMGMQANAALCWSNWRHYKVMDGDHYIRVFDSDPVVTLAAV
jgi:hypothetical protein